MAKLNFKRDLTLSLKQTYALTRSVMAQTPSRPYPDLATWRAAQGLSQHAAARKLGISQTYYSRLERGVQAARGPVAKRLMAATGVPLEVLVGAA